MKTYKIYFTINILLIVLAGCASATKQDSHKNLSTQTVNTPTIRISPTFTISPSPLPTNTSTQIPTETPKPSPTFTHTASPTNTATKTPDPNELSDKERDNLLGDKPFIIFDNGNAREVDESELVFTWIDSDKEQVIVNWKSGEPFGRYENAQWFYLTDISKNSPTKMKIEGQLGGCILGFATNEDFYIRSQETQLENWWKPPILNPTKSNEDLVIRAFANLKKANADLIREEKNIRYSDELFYRWTIRLLWAQTIYQERKLTIPEVEDLFKNGLAEYQGNKLSGEIIIRVDMGKSQKNNNVDVENGAILYSLDINYPTQIIPPDDTSSFFTTYTLSKITSASGFRGKPFPVKYISIADKMYYLLREILFLYAGNIQKTPLLVHNCSK